MTLQILGSTDSDDEQQLVHVDESKPEMSSEVSSLHRLSVSMSPHDSLTTPCPGKCVLYLNLLAFFVCIVFIII